MTAKEWEALAKLADAVKTLLDLEARKSGGSCYGSCYLLQLRSDVQTSIAFADEERREKK